MFLGNDSVRFYLSGENLEDLEGYNDVWNHVLNEDIVDNQILMQESSVDIFNNE